MLLITIFYYLSVFSLQSGVTQTVSLTNSISESNGIKCISQVSWLLKLFIKAQYVLIYLVELTKLATSHVLNIIK